MIKFTHKGDFGKLDNYFQRVLSVVEMDRLNRIGRRGVEALAEATPKRTGKTAESWSYTIEDQNGVISIIFTNSNVINDWYNVAIMIQYGHATGTGGWVEGIDYINPALRPIFESLADEAWKEVISA